MAFEALMRRLEAWPMWPLELASVSPDKLLSSTAIIEACSAVKALRFAQLTLFAFVFVCCGICLALLFWKYKVSRYNDYWELKSSVHYWENFTTSAQPQYCSACKQLICGFWIFRNTGWECTVCGRTAHSRCLGACNKFDCKCPSQSKPLAHQLVQGNLPNNSFCCICGIICSSPFGLHGLRCLWCHRTVDEGCARYLTEYCDIGRFSRLVLPPNFVRLSVASTTSPHTRLGSFLNMFNLSRQKRPSVKLPNEPLPSSANSKNLEDYKGFVSRSMSAQLRGGLNKVQIAMAAGLSEGLKEVSQDLTYLTAVIQTKFKQGPRKSIKGPPLHAFPSDESHSETSDSKPQHLRLRKRHRCSSTPSLKRSKTEPLEVQLPPLNLQQALTDPTMGCSVSPPGQMKIRENFGQRHFHSTSYRHAVSRSGSSDDHSQRPRSGRACPSTLPAYPHSSCDFPTKQTSYDRSSSAEFSHSHTFFQSDIHSLHHTLFSPTHFCLPSPRKSDKISKTRQRYRRHRVRCLERQKLERLAVKFASQSSHRYDERLFELARLMPVRADVWDIVLDPGLDSLSHLFHNDFETKKYRFQYHSYKPPSYSQQRLMATTNLFSSSSASVSSDTLSDMSAFHVGAFPSMPSARRTSPPQIYREKKQSFAVKSSSVKHVKSASAIPQLTQLANHTPLLVFINVRSGGLQGAQLLKEFYKYLNPIQVVNLQSENEPERALKLFAKLASLRRLRILLCGGDGTVGWVLNYMQKAYGPDYDVPISILPLGTGNDLSRVLGWGSNFDGNLASYFIKLESSQTTSIDLWKIKIYSLKPKAKGCLLNQVFTNYMDIGVAARVANRFHELRQAHPEIFCSQLENKFLYGELGIRDWVSEKSVDLSGIEIHCDDAPIALMERLEGIIVCNIPSFSAGVNLWDCDSHSSKGSISPFKTNPVLRSKSPLLHSLVPTRSSEHQTPHTWKRQSMRDELIEVVGIRSLFHLGQVQVGLADPIKLCQGKKIKMIIPISVPFQVDGEPRMLPPCTLQIRFK